MTTALAVISYLGFLGGAFVFGITLFLKLIFLLSKMRDQTVRTNKVLAVSGIVVVVSVITMVVVAMTDTTCAHEYAVVEQQDATCTVGGYIKKTCKHCNDEIIETIEPHHVWLEEIVVEATCTAPRQLKKTCSGCGKVEYEATGAVSHSWVAETIIEATCSAPKQLVNKCSICGVTETISEGSVLPHAFGDWIINVSPTYEQEGQKTRECVACNFVENASVPKNAYIEISATELRNAFEENEIAAEQKYKGKIVRVTGVIEDINSAGTFSDANVILKTDSLWDGIQCCFDSQNANVIATLHKGESVTIEGTCGDLSVFNVFVNACRVIE